MIARLEGILQERTPTRVVIDVGGVGYEALIPLSTFSMLPDEGERVSLQIHTHVRDDALQLFGFATPCERDVFELLLHASRVGPKLAQTILSGIDAGTLARAIRDGDVATLTAVPGVGAKTAQRIVVELRDRIDGIAAGPAGRGAPVPSPEGTEALHQQLVSALVNLQIARGKAERVAQDVVAKHGSEAAVEELIRAALQRLAR